MFGSPAAYTTDRPAARCTGRCSSHARTGTCAGNHERGGDGEESGDELHVCN